VAELRLCCRHRCDKPNPNRLVHSLETDRGIEAERAGQVADAKPLADD
jgi:hypothetical protein